MVLALQGLRTLATRPPRVEMNDPRPRWAASLRSIYEHLPRQGELARLLRQGGQRIALQANRRATKTETIGRELGALDIEQDQRVTRQLTTDYATAADTWLQREGDDGLIGLMRGMGVPFHVTQSGGGIQRIRWPWGSSWVVHTMNDLHQIQRRRGRRGHDFWADEAQGLRYLSAILGKVVGAAASDFDANVILSGTPGEEIGGLFYQMSTSPDSPYTRLRFYSWDNPLYGPDPESRWRTYMERFIIPDRLIYGLDGDDIDALLSLTTAEREMIATADDALLPAHLRDLVRQLHPDLLREAFGRWVIDASGYVLDVHRVEPRDMYWGHAVEPKSHDDRAMRIPVLGDIPARVAALPTVKWFDGPRRKDWYVGLGVDLGHSPDPFAWTAIAWSLEDPHVYELGSYKEWELSDSQMLDRVAQIIDLLRGQDLRVIVAVADVTGARVGTGAEWSGHLAARFPAGAAGLIPPDKRDPVLLQYRSLNVDIMRGRIKLLRNSELDIEARNLKWKPFDPDVPRPPDVDKYREVVLADGRRVRPGDHNLDCFRYVNRWVNLHWKPSTPMTEDPTTERSQIRAFEAMAQPGLK